ncbi:MAG: phage major capsid protein [Acidobacteriota bacterium]
MTEAEKLKQASDEIIDRIKQYKRGTDARLDRIEAWHGAPDAGGGPAGPNPFGNYKTPGARLIEAKDAFEMFARTRRVRLDIGAMWPSFEGKTLIDSAALGFSTPGILGAQRVEGIVPLARRRLTVRDLLRTKPVTAGQVDWIRELAFTNAASPQAEGGSKAESADTFIIASDKVHTIAHWIPLTKQALDDLPELRVFIDDVLIYGLKLKEELELLSGDNLGDHLHGLIPQATSYAGSYAAAGDTKLDRLRHAVLELEDGDEACTGFVLNPRDAHDIDLIKTEEGGVNKGSYVVGDPLGGTLLVKTYWRRPVVETNSITAGTFLAGDFGKALIADRMDATIDLSESHDDFFVKNKVAIRAEERMTLCVLRPSSFLTGSF